MSEVKLAETTDASVWAAEFMRTKKEQGWTLEEIDEDLMLGWFANAMCAQMDKDRAELERMREAREQIEKTIGDPHEMDHESEWLGETTLKIFEYGGTGEEVKDKPCVCAICKAKGG
jgi:hypothetical protein